MFPSSIKSATAAAMLCMLLQGVSAAPANSGAALQARQDNSTGDTTGATDNNSPLSSLASTAMPSTTAPAAPAAGTPPPTQVGALCQLDNRGFWKNYNVTLTGWPQDQRNCGQGLLDNLRGQCGVITDWQCWYTDGPTNNVARVTFTDAAVGKDQCVPDAIYLASQGAKLSGVQCLSPQATLDPQSKASLLYATYYNHIYSHQR